MARTFSKCGGWRTRRTPQARCLSLACRRSDCATEPQRIPIGGGNPGALDRPACRAGRGGQAKREGLPSRFACNQGGKRRTGSVSERSTQRRTSPNASPRPTTCRRVARPAWGQHVLAEDGLRWRRRAEKMKRNVPAPVLRSRAARTSGESAGSGVSHFFRFFVSAFRR